MPILHRAIGVTKEGKTPLMDAVIKGDAERVNTLIAEGVNVKEAARKRGCEEIASMLEEAESARLVGA